MLLTEFIWNCNISPLKKFCLCNDCIAGLVMMKNFLDCVGLKPGFSWICGHIAENKFSFMVKNESINCGFKFFDSNELKVSYSEFQISQQEIQHRYFL